MWHWPLEDEGRTEPYLPLWCHEQIWHTFYYPYHLLHLVYIYFFKWINPMLVYICWIYTITLVYYLTYRQWRICMIDENCCSTLILLFCPYYNLLKLLFDKILYLLFRSWELHHNLNHSREYCCWYLKSKIALAINITFCSITITYAANSTFCWR